MLYRIILGIIRHPVRALFLLTKHRSKVFAISNAEFERVVFLTQRVRQLLPAQPNEDGLIQSMNLDAVVNEFPFFEAPAVSIVIPAYNQWQMTERCFKSVIRSVKNTSYEVILADDCSTDATVGAGSRFKNLIISRSEANLGFTKNCNVAAKLARGKYIVLLNNDTVVGDDWLVGLYQTMEATPRAAICGSKLLYPDGNLQEAGGIIWRDASAWNYGNGKDPGLAEFNYLKQVDYCSAASIIVRKSFWLEVGGFDERYSPAYYEDTDLAMMALAAGHQVLYQPKSWVIHFEGASHGTDINHGLKAHQQRNYRRFQDKWRNTLLQNHFPNGCNVFHARDKSQDKRTILIVDHYVPWSDQDAGSRSTYMYIQFLVELGYNVKFIGDNFFAHEPYTEQLQQLGVEVLVGNHYADNWQDWFTANVHSIDVVYCHRPHIAPKYIEFIKANSKAKIVYQCHDLHHLRFDRAARITKDAELAKQAKHWESVELALFDTSDIGLTFSRDERDFLLEKGLSCNIQQIPLFVYDGHCKQINDFSGRQGIMFVGGFNHAPNEEGVLWFLDHVWPLIIALQPDVVFYIAGSKVTDTIKSRQSHNIVVRGFVTDEQLQELYQSVCVNVLPLLHGAGVKGKLVESMFYGTPVVGTSIGLEGLAVSDYGMEMHDEPTAFANKVIELLGSDIAWRSEQVKLKKVFNDNFVKNKVSDHIKAIF